MGGKGIKVHSGKKCGGGRDRGEDGLSENRKFSGKVEQREQRGERPK